MQHRPIEEISAGGQLIFFVVSCLCHLKSCCHWHVSLGDGFTNVDVSLSAVEKVLSSQLLLWESPMQIPSQYYDC